MLQVQAQQMMLLLLLHGMRQAGNYAPASLTQQWPKVLTDISGWQTRSSRGEAGGKPVGYRTPA